MVPIQEPGELIMCCLMLQLLFERYPFGNVSD